eukprot:gene16798-16246_t
MLTDEEETAYKEIFLTIKLLQNKTTAQVIASFKRAKAAELYAHLDAQQLGFVTDDEVRAVVGALEGPAAVAADELARACEHALATVPPADEQPQGTLNAEQFVEVVGGGLGIKECVEALAAAGARGDGRTLSPRAVVVEQRGRPCVRPQPPPTGEVARRIAPRHPRTLLRGMTRQGSVEPSMGFRNSSFMGGATQDLLVTEQKLGEAQVELAAARKGQTQAQERVAEAERARLEKENKDLVYETEKMRRKLKSARSAMASSTDNGQEARRMLEVKTRELKEMESNFHKELAAKDVESGELKEEIDGLRAQIAKMKQEAGRRGAALAMLHKHVGELEEANDTLRKGAGGCDGEYARDAAAREVTNKTVEDLQQDIWFRDRKAYLQQGQGRLKGLPSADGTASMRSATGTDPTDE